MNALAVNCQDVPSRRLTVGPLDSRCSDLGVAAGTRKLGLRRFEIEPGKRSTPAHTHSAAGTGIAHAFRGGSDGLTFLAYGNRDSDDVVWYPRSQKIAFFSLGVMGPFEPCGYWDGEE